VGYCYPSRLERTLYKWDTYVPLVMNGLERFMKQLKLSENLNFTIHQEQKNMFLPN
jgi:hypothetical protein